jgi:hypothetical protein
MQLGEKTTAGWHGACHLSAKAMSGTLKGYTGRRGLSAPWPPGRPRPPGRERRRRRRRRAARQRAVAVAKQLRLGRKLARTNVVEPSCADRTSACGWLTQRKARRTASAEARRVIDRSIAEALAGGALDQETARSTHAAMRAELDTASLDSVMARSALATGRRGWWSMLRRVTGPREAPFSRLELIVDGPEFRDAVHDLVGRADGFLHISGLEWNNDPRGAPCRSRSPPASCA